MSTSELIAAARDHGLELIAETGTTDEMGLDFVVVHARDPRGRRWILRRPRRPDVVISARHEARVLALVQGRIDAEVPDWQVHTDELIAYPRLDGTPAVTLDGGAPAWNIIDPAAPGETFIASCARVYAKLMAIDASAAGITTKSVDQVRQDIREAIEATREVLQPSAAMLARWQRWLEGPTWPAHTGLVHGDLHPGHMLLDPTGTLTGVLDWTEAMVTDPAIDLALFGGCFGRPALEDLVRRITEAGTPLWPAVVEHALERWAVSPAVGAKWALDHDNAAVLEHTRSMLATLEA